MRGHPGSGSIVRYQVQLKDLIHIIFYNYIINRNKILYYYGSIPKNDIKNLKK